MSTTIAKLEYLKELREACRVVALAIVRAEHDPEMFTDVKRLFAKLGEVNEDGDHVLIDIGNKLATLAHSDPARVCGNRVLATAAIDRLCEVRLVAQVHIVRLEEKVAA